MALENVGPVVLQSTTKKCSFCNHYGASVICNTDGCSKIYHFPCATAAGAFQESMSLTAFCSNHLSQVAMLCECKLNDSTMSCLKSHIIYISNCSFRVLYL